MTSWPLERRTRAILRKAELGFLGVVVVTLVHTPRLKGLPLGSGVRLRCRLSRVYCMAGLLDLALADRRLRRINWLNVGM